MLQRGRKSAAANLVTPDLTGTRSRLTAPEYLSTEEEALFDEIVAVSDRQHLVLTDVPLLVCYVQSYIKARALVSDPDKIREWEKTVRTMTMLARSLRLTPQSRVHPEKAGRSARDQKRAALAAELFNYRAPWSDDDDHEDGDDDNGSDEG
jgi:phage terminase small subunit